MSQRLVGPAGLILAVVLGAAAWLLIWALAGDPPHDERRYVDQLAARLETTLEEAHRDAPSAQTGHLALAFRVGADGGIATQDLIVRSGHPDLDALAIRALVAALPLPPPPAGFARSLVWEVNFAGNPPFSQKLHIQ